MLSVFDYYCPCSKALATVEDKKLNVQPWICIVITSVKSCKEYKIKQNNTKAKLEFMNT